MTTATTRKRPQLPRTHTAGRTPEELRELVSHVGAGARARRAHHRVGRRDVRRPLLHHLLDGRRGARAPRLEGGTGVDVVFLDTGYHFVETIGTWDAVEATLDVNLITITPVQSVAEQDAEHGKDLYKTDSGPVLRTAQGRAARELPRGVRRG